jgi:hypothetical protein
MARDVNKAMSDEKERRIESALQSFMEHVLGSKRNEKWWMDV